MGKIDNNILVKYLLGECSILESQEVDHWLNLSIDNRKEFEAVKKVWQSAYKTNEIYSTVDVEAELPKFLRHMDMLETGNFDSSLTDKPKKLFALSFLKVASIVLASLGIGSLFTYISVSGKFENNLNNKLSHQIIAPIGGKSIAILPDGTKVWLNAGTTLKYSSNYGVEKRDVELVGEAYFKVITNPEKPFTVITSELKIKAYGTSFNVKAYPDEKLITTTLEEGKVNITGKGVDIALKPKQNISYERRVFKATPEAPVTTKKHEEKVPIEKETVPHIETLTDVNTQLFTSWKDDRLIIESKGLSDISVLLERKFNVTINLKSEELLKYKFRGTFTNETLEQILNVFRFMAPLNYNIEKGIVTIDLDKTRKSNYTDIIQ